MRNSLLAALLLFFILLAGCTAQQEQQPPKTEAPVIVPQQKHVSISVIRVPSEILNEGDKFSVMWYVDSEPVSQASSTAVQYGEEPESAAMANGTYPLSTPIQTGTVPGTFSAEITAGEKNIYLRVHAAVDGKDYWTDESTVRVRAIPLNLSIAITQAPRELNAYEGFQVNWTVVSNKAKRLDAMELRYGPESGAVAGAAAYPQSRMILDAEAPGSYGMRFDPFKKQGITYFRVHVQVEGRDYWSDEFSIHMVQQGFIVGN